MQDFFHQQLSNLKPWEEEHIEQKKPKPWFSPGILIRHAIILFYIKDPYEPIRIFMECHVNCPFRLAPKHPLNELRNENTKIPLLGSTRNRTKSVHFREELEDEKEREHGFGARNSGWRQLKYFLFSSLFGKMIQFD